MNEDACATAKLEMALAALPHTTIGNWWVCDRGELHSDPIGSVKLAKCIDGHSPESRSANRKLIAASRELAQEVLRLRELVKDAFREGYTVRGHQHTEHTMRSIEVFCSEHGISPATPEAIARAIEKEEFRNLWCSFKQEAPLRGESWHGADRSVGIVCGFFEEMAVAHGGPKWAEEVLKELSADTYQELLEEEMDTFVENAR